MLIYPHLNPIALQIGPIAIRWYSLAYIGGILFGWLYLRCLHRRFPVPGLTAKALDDIILWLILGIVAGGRLGYILFYKPDYYLAHPFEIFALWQGGMSFHGGLMGVLIAMWGFCRKHGIVYLALMDCIAAAAPIGLFLGRIANFVNGELYGRITDSGWGMVFPQGGELPRHPSQLYEAGMEGIILFMMLFLLVRFTQLRRFPGVISGFFLSGYAISRIIAECFREPDVQLGYLFGFVTMGQLLSIPLLGFAIWLITSRIILAKKSNQENNATIQP